MGLEWIVHLSDRVISIWEGVWVDSNERSALTQRLQKHIYTIYKEEFPVLLNVWSVQDLVLLLFIETFSQLLLVYNSVFSSVQSLSHVRLFATPQTAARQASLSITNSQSLLKFMSIGSVMPSNHSTIVPFSPAFNLSQHQGLFQRVSSSPSCGQSIGVSASTSVLPMNIQDWFPLGWTVWISLQSKGLSKVFSNTTVQKHQFFGTQLSL